MQADRSKAAKLARRSESSAAEAWNEQEHVAAALASQEDQVARLRGRLSRLQGELALRCREFDQGVVKARTVQQESVSLRTRLADEKVATERLRSAADAQREQLALAVEDFDGRRSCWALNACQVVSCT